MKVWERAKWVSLLYPGACESCGGASDDVLCQECYGQLELIEPHARCGKCFAPLDEEKCGRSHTEGCFCTTLFERDSPAKKLVDTMQRCETPRLQKLFASFCVMQAERMQWPAPDHILATPKLLLFAQTLATFYHVPAINTFAKNRSGKNFALRPTIPPLHDQNLYLLDTQITPATTSYAKLLDPLSPKKIYIISFLESSYIS